METVRVSARIWNADGSEAAMSGNGLNCLAHAVARRYGKIPLKVVVTLPSGEHTVEVHHPHLPPTLAERPS